MKKHNHSNGKKQVQEVKHPFSGLDIAIAKQFDALSVGQDADGVHFLTDLLSNNNFSKDFRQAIYEKLHSSPSCYD